MTVLESAVEILGWPGVLFPDVRLLGTRVAIVATVDTDLLAQRRDLHPEPMLDDPDTLAMWEWPGCDMPPSPLTLTGVLVADQASRRAVRTASEWRGFAPAAVLLDAPDDRLLLEADGVGVAVLVRAGEGVRLVQAGADCRVATSRRQTMDRWVEEHLYGMLRRETPVGAQ